MDLTSRKGLFGRAALLLLPILLSGCAEEYPQSTINPKTDFAEIIHTLYTSVFWWTMVILAVVWVILAYVLVKFRAREGDGVPKQIRGHVGLELGWTVGPALIVIAITIPTIQGVFATQRPISDDALVVEVTGHRYWWQFHYPEQGVTTANELRLPVDRPVTLRLASTDVIHSFWVPMLGGKRDVNPVPAVREGRSPKYNWLYFTPFETGVYMGQCAEFCGEAHAFMAMRVVVESEEEFSDWITKWHEGDPGPVSEPETDPSMEDSDFDETDPMARQAGPVDQLAVVGRDVFLNQSTCVACHAVNGTSAQGVIGPNLTLFGERTTLAAGIRENTMENLIQWITDPHSMKPGAAMPGVDYNMAIPGAAPWPATGLNEEQVRAVAAYLLSLR
jgi:cytochrome c oxidase subunit II